MRTTLRMGAAAALFICTCAGPTSAAAQDNPLSTNAKFLYSGLKLFLLGSAEKMPEENFGFKPTAEVRSFGQILGHVADAQYRFCSVALGEKSPAPEIERRMSSKADLVASLKEAFAYCDRAYNALTDESAGQVLKLGPGMPRLGVLAVNGLHTALHYGNLITYMRLKNVVPPSSDAAYMAQTSSNR